MGFVFTTALFRLVRRVYPHIFKIVSELFYAHLFILLRTEGHTAGMALIGSTAE